MFIKFIDRNDLRKEVLNKFEIFIEIFDTEFTIVKYIGNQNTYPKVLVSIHDFYKDKYKNLPYKIQIKNITSILLMVIYQFYKEENRQLKDSIADIHLHLPKYHDSVIKSIQKIKLLD